ncbi:MAG: hypothetical protein DCF25_08695 [Leptolyngbya foveolarum]|uniref:Uncharacterized protein n=1 Tax=Leptolyngbya foveolarum TaxID=47253 RepID=A0A2W4W4J1_9CYAN|nr:MAG: hypothetical protein DCF25_08695 [Leptolyngbya foveolarum]
MKIFETNEQTVFSAFLLKILLIAAVVGQNANEIKSEFRSIEEFSACLLTTCLLFLFITAVSNYCRLQKIKNLPKVTGFLSLWVEKRLLFGFLSRLLVV